VNKRDRQLEQMIFEAVKARDVAGAISLVGGDNHQSVYKEITLIGPSSEMIRWAFTDTPKLLRQFPDYLMPEIRTAAAMFFLVGDVNLREWLPRHELTARGFDLEYGVRALATYIQCRRHVETWKKMGCVSAVEISNSNFDVCPQCKELGTKRWPLGEQPEIPYEHCTAPKGCHCAYVAYLESGPQTS
jgi:hypothetical protein